MSITIRAWGPYACFTRPEMKVERVSYDVITPSAARGLFESIYWKPQFQWVINRIQVMKRPQFISFGRNEVNSGVTFGRDGTPSTQHYNTKQNRVCRSSQILRDVEYYITASVRCHECPPKEGEKDNNKPPKHYDIFSKRASTGGYYRKPVFGCSEYGADFELADEIPPSPLTGVNDLGFMFHDFIYQPQQRPQPRFFHAKMINGVILVPSI